MSQTEDDERQIRALVARQFAALCWTEGGKPDLAAFEDDFLPGAQLFASARPASVQSVHDFGERMERLAGTTLTSFHEDVLGVEIRIFGNVSTAAVACENTENGASISRNLEMMLLVRTAGRWMIVAQAWDRETETNPLPDGLLAAP